MKCEEGLCKRDCVAKQLEYAIVSTGELPQQDAVVMDCEGRVEWVNWISDMGEHDEEIKEIVGSATDSISVSGSISEVREAHRPSN
jgi:hypothetical protein